MMVEDALSMEWFGRLSTPSWKACQPIDHSTLSGAARRRKATRAMID